MANLTPEVDGILKAVRPDASAASWALRFVGSLDGIMTVLSGMSDEAQMADNLNTFTDFEPLSEKEKNTIAKAVEKIQAILSRRDDFRIES